MGRHDETAGGSAAIRPVGEEDVERAGHLPLRRAGAGVRQSRPVAEQGQVAEHVLAVLGPDDDHPAAGRLRHGAPRQVGHVRVQVAPLRRQEVHKVDVLGGRLEQGGRRREEMDVGVGRHPAAGMEVDRPVERVLEAACPRLDLDPLADGCAVEPAHDLDVDAADGQVNGEQARDVRVRGGPEDEVAAGVLEEGRVDLIAMTHRWQVPAIGRREPHASRNPFAGRPVHELHLDRHARRGQHLDRAATRGVVRPAAVEQIASRDLPVADADDRVRRDREVDDGRSLGRAVRVGPRRPPAGDHRGARVGRGIRRSRPDRRPEVDLRRRAAGPLDPDREARAPGERVRRSAEERHRGDDDVAPRPAFGERLEVHRHRFGAGRELDGVEPEQGVVRGARHEVGHPDLVPAVRPGHDRQRARLAGRGIPSAALGGMRAAPVEDLVGQVGDRGERRRTPAQDPVGDLEPAADRPRRRPPGAVHHRVSRERFADRDHVAHRHPGRPGARVVAPGIAQVGDDEVAHRSAGRKVDRRGPLDEDPPSRIRPGIRSQLERQTVEHPAPGRQAGQGSADLRMEPAGRLAVRGAPEPVEVDGPREGARTPGHGRLRSRNQALY